MNDITNEALPKKFELSRKDFLKVASVGAGALALGKYLNREGDRNHEVEGKWRVLEGGDGGLYIPIYEDHKRPWPAEQFTDMPNIDVVMYEVVRPSKDMENQTGEQLLGKADEVFARDTWVPKDQSKYWGEKGTFVAFEGLDYPAEAMVMQYTFGTLLEGLAGISSLAASFGEKFAQPVKIADKEIMTGEMRKMLMRAGGIWGSTAWLQMGLGAYLNTMTSSGSEGMVNVPLKIQRLESLTTQVHPEFNLVFFRNLIMARRLQAIKELFPQSIRDVDRQKGSPTSVAFNVGAMHSGIEDWLTLGPDIVKFMIELTPNGIWKQMVEINGGSDSMSTMPLVLNNGILGSKVIRLKDNWLQETIDKKIS